MSSIDVSPLYKEESIQLVAAKKDGTLEITTQAINFLNTLQNTKIAILSITGPTKTGKTLLANEIIKKQNGFANEGTKGLFLWGVPFDLDNGAKLLIIDSQGLSKSDPDLLGQKLFELLILISTCLIFNTKNEIDDDIISNLADFIDLANKINVEPDNIENKRFNNVDNLALYFPDFIWALRDCNKEKEPNVYMEECLNKNPKSENIKRLFKHRKCFFFPNNKNKDNIQNVEFTSRVNAMYEMIKGEIQIKKINNFEIDGESLFGVLQNYLDSINNDENPIISLSLGNVILSKTKNILENNFESFKSELSQSFESKYPMSYIEIHKTFIEVQDRLIEKFFSEIQAMLTIKQVFIYIVELQKRMRTELENILETNEIYYNDLFDNEYNELEKTLSGLRIEKLDDIKYFFSKYTTEVLNAIQNFLNIPNSEFCKNLIIFLIKIVQDHITSKMQNIGELIISLFSNYESDISNKIDNLNNNINTLNDQLALEKKIIEEKNKEKSELSKQYLKLETKYDKLTIDFKAMESEYTNNINIEVQKLQKMELSYKNQLNEIEQENTQLKEKIDKLSKEIEDINTQSSNKIKELNRENLKLQMELKRLNEQEKKTKNEISDNKSLTFQSLFKNIQNTIMEFKESLDKLGKESGKFNNKNNSESAFESKLNEWMEGIEKITMSCGEQIKKINDNHVITVKNIMNEMEGVKLELMEKNYSLEEHKIAKEISEKKLKDANGKIEKMTTILKSSDKLREMHEETIKMLKDKIKGLENKNEELYVDYNKKFIDYKMKEDEVETLVMLIEGMLGRRKDKYEHNISKLPDETKVVIETLVKKYKLFK